MTTALRLGEMKAPAAALKFRGANLHHQHRVRDTWRVVLAYNLQIPARHTRTAPRGQKIGFSRGEGFIFFIALIMIPPRYRTHFNEKRRDQVKTAEDIIEHTAYEFRYKLLRAAIDEIFRQLHKSRKVLLNVSREVDWEQETVLLDHPTF